MERRLLDAAMEAGLVETEQDFPEWILSSIPQTPDRTMALQGMGESPVPSILESIDRLAGLGSRARGADFVVIACNTAHAFLEEIRSASALPVLEIPATAAESIARLHPGSCVGILATTGMLQSGVYQEAFRRWSVPCLTLHEIPDGAGIQERLIMRVLYGSTDGAFAGIKVGGVTQEAVDSIREAADQLSRNGADIILAACSELSIAIGAAWRGLGFHLDALDLAARRCIEIAYGLQPLDSLTQQPEMQAQAALRSKHEE